MERTGCGWAAVTIREIQARAADYYDLPISTLTGRSRRANAVEARHVAMYVALAKGHRVVDIGNAFNRHHSTVSKACQKIKGHMYVPEIKEGVAVVKAVCDVVIEIEELAPGLNELMRMHYHAYKIVRDRWTVMTRLYAGPPRRIESCEVEIERRYARLPLDVDNAFASAKIPLDAMRHAGVIAEDDPNTVTALRMKQTKVDTVAEEKTIIKVVATAKSTM